MQANHKGCDRRRRQSGTLDMGFAKLRCAAGTSNKADAGAICLWLGYPGRNRRVRAARQPAAITSAAMRPLGSRRQSPVAGDQSPVAGGHQALNINVWATYEKQCREADLRGLGGAKVPWLLTKKLCRHLEWHLSFNPSYRVQFAVHFAWATDRPPPPGVSRE